jgi:hypothetical protein
MTTKKNKVAAYDSFHIALHGTLMLLLNEKSRTAEIRVPFNSCHRYVAAYLKENGDVEQSIDLGRDVYFFDPLPAPASRLEISTPDPDHMTVTFPGADGPCGWCKIAEFPWPDQLLGWRNFPKSMLNASGQTYQNDGLDAVDLNNGVPMVYVLLYGPQAHEITLKNRTTGEGLPIPPTGGVGRLHIYAEAAEDSMHDAVSTLNSCAHPPFDIGIRSSTPNDMPDPQTPPDPSLALNEQRSLQEQTEHRGGRPLTALAGLPLPFANMSATPSFGRPRTCTPVVALDPAS